MTSRTNYRWTGSATRSHSFETPGTTITYAQITRHSGHTLARRARGGNSQLCALCAGVINSSGVFDEQDRVRATVNRYYII